MAGRQTHKLRVLIVSKTTNDIVDAVELVFSKDGRLCDHQFELSHPDHVFLPYIHGQQIYTMYGRSGSGKTTMIETLMVAFCSFQPRVGFEERGSENVVLVISNKENDPSLQEESSHSLLKLKKGMKSPLIAWKHIDWWKTYREDLGVGITVNKVFAYYEEFHRGEKSHGLVIIDDLLKRNNADDDNTASFVSNFVQMYRQYGFTLFISKHSMSAKNEIHTKKETDISFIFPNAMLPRLETYLQDTINEDMVKPVLEEIKDLQATEYDIDIGVSYVAVKANNGITISRRRIKRESDAEFSSVQPRPKKRKHEQGEEGEEDSESRQLRVGGGKRRRKEESQPAAKAARVETTYI